MTDNQREADGVVERLAEIKARVDAATKGPWTLENDWTIEVSGGDGLIAKMQLQDGVNAKFIVNARSDIPWLLAHISRLEAEKAECVRILESVQPRIAESAIVFHGDERIYLKATIGAAIHAAKGSL